MKMKKLTEDWKIKKGNLRNKSFRDSIDDALSKVSENEHVSRKDLLNCMQKKEFPNKSPFLNLNNSHAGAKDSLSVPVRRSCRLKEKSQTLKMVDKRTKCSLDDTSFLFSESFGLKMANEASRFENRYKSDTSASSDVNFVKGKAELVPTDLKISDLKKSEDKLQNWTENTTNSSTKATENKTVKESSSISSSCKKFNKKAEPFNAEQKKVNTCEEVCSKTRNIEVKKDSVISSLPEEKKVKVDHGSEISVDSCLSNKSSFEGEDCYDLTYWGLPDQVISAYKARNINKMFLWQYECLSMKDVLNGKNLVYSAPTSAGKTLVAEILMLKNVLENKKKAMMILPFVSVVREKVNYFQEMFQDTGIIVGGYMGTHRPPGGFNATDIAICTIEKANNLINRLMEENRLDELGILVVDELHMLGDNSRGYLLELLLTKLLYNCKKNDISIQIIGMSATLPNLNVLSFWLQAELYHTDFRPVPLHEMYKVGPVVYDSKTSKPLRKLGGDGIIFSNDSDHTIYLTIETVASGNGVLIFCPSKNWCESLATTIAREIYNVGRPTAEEHKNPKYSLIGQKLRQYIDGSLLSDILLQLRNSPAGLDAVLKLTVPFGVAFHHAGLTFDERDIIEGAFKQGAIKVLVATSTLSSGVNLPARRVLIRSPLFCGSVIDTLSYKQMVGRAGRKGIDDQGESILLCKESEKKSGQFLVSSELKPVKSCLMKSGKDGVHASLKRAIIEVIASGAAVTHEEVIKYVSCTLLFASLIQEDINRESSENNVETSINKCLDYLLDNDFIFKIVKEENDASYISYKPSQLGSAILASGFSPEDSLRVLKELQLARRCFVLENDLHILYEVTPPYLSDQMGSLNWMNFLTIWEQLSEDYRRVGELVGVRESFIGLGIQGKIKTASAQAYHKLAVHQRFYAALALNELIQEVPLSVVSEKYNCNRGILQSLQQTTSTFSGMLTVFCNRLGWYNLELLFSHFQKRVHFGIQQELCDLIQLSALNAQRARVLYNAGYETISSLASADPSEVELALCNAGAFESEKQLEGDAAEEAMKRLEVKRIRITGKRSMNEREAAVLIIEEAQNFIKHELGIKTISWQTPQQRDASKSNEEEVISDILKNNIQESKLAMTLKSNNNISERNKHSSKEGKIKDNGSLSVKHGSERSITVSQRGNKLNSCELPELGNTLSQKSNRDDSLSINCKENMQILIDKNSKSVDLNSGCSKKYTKSINVENSELVTSSQDKANFNSERDTSSVNHSSSNNKDNLNAHDKCRVIKNLSHTDLNACSTSQNHESSPDSSMSLLENNARNTDCSMSKEQLSSTAEFQKDSLQKKTCDNNESYFCTEDMNSLFDVLEKTVHRIENETMKENEKLDQDNDLTFSQLLLSQSAEAENVYHVQSFMNSDFDKLSFSDCLEENLDANISLSNSKREEMQIKFTTKRTRDILDAIFDSPTHEEEPSSKEKEIIPSFKTCSLQLSNIDILADVPSDSCVLSKGKNPVNCFQINSFKQCSSNIANGNFRKGEEINNGMEEKFTNYENLGSPFLERRDDFDILCANKNFASQSTPKGDVQEAKYCENPYSPIETHLPALTENVNVDFSELNFTKTDLKKKDFKNNSLSICSKNSETSGDLFESEGSVDVDLFNKAQVKASIAEADIHSLSSCSNDIFESDKSFEGMLENPCNVHNNIHSLQDINVNDKNRKEIFCHVKDNLEKYENEVKTNLNDENPKLTSDTAQLSPNTIKQIALENSGDIFEDSSKSEQIFIDPKKKLSFEFEDNSEVFKSWNTSPNHTVCPKPRDDNEAAQKQNIIPEENKLNDANKFSFLANVSDFSIFASDSIRNDPTEKVHTSGKVALQTSSCKIINNTHKLAVKNQIENKSLPKINGINSNSIISSDSKLSSEKSLSVGDADFKIVDILEEEFYNFLQILEEVPMFGISVACERIEHKNVKNIGPPKLRAKNSSTSSEKILINDDILAAGLSFCWGEKVFFINFTTESHDGTKNCHLRELKTKLEVLQKSFQGFTSKKIVAYDLKSYYSILLKSCRIDLSENKNASCLDPSIAAWLLDPSERQQTLQELVLNYWPEAVHLIEGFDRGHGSLGLQHWSSVPGRQRAAAEAYISFHVIKKLLDLLKTRKLYKSFVDIEMPSIITLAEMEQNGLGFDLKLAMDFRKELQKKQNELLKKAHQLAGHSFNIMSSRDLSRILYKELKLTPSDANLSPMASRQLSLGIVTRGSGKKLPPELKTNKECLEKIMHLHPLPKVIMDWRKLSFAVSKVLIPLLRENKFDGESQMHRMHSTCYVYTVTGRINMHKPNLQFIPRDFNIDDNASEEFDHEEYNKIDSDISQYGICLRNMFIASEGNVLLSADYSQLELRILAHLSGDVKLLKSLNSGDDIFKQIAASWKNISLSSVTDEIRQQAKKICYGIIYGMSPKTLSHQLKTSENDASYFMETFKRSYPGMTNYLNSVLENCRRKGYVATIRERRRYLPHILSENKGERAHAERQAINTTVQGSAADIIKKAMIEIEKQLKRLFGEEAYTQTIGPKGIKKSRKLNRAGFLVLQLHDELIYEVSKSDLEAVKDIVKTVMETSTALSVILPVNLKVGSSWGSMKEIS